MRPDGRYRYLINYTMSFILLLLSGTCSALASVLLRMAAGRVISPDDVMVLGVSSGPMIYRMAAIGAYGAGFALYAFALRRVELSVAYPFMVAVTIFEILLFGLASGETLSLRTVTGAALLLFSVVLLYSPRASSV